MRKATMYTIEAREVMATDRFEYYQQRRLPSLDEILAGDDVLTMTDHKISVPVERVVRIEHGKQTDNFIAMSPELREILEAPLERHIVELKQEVLRAEAFLKAERQRTEEFLSTIATYNNLPWYKRIFKKVQYPLPNYHR